MAIPAACLFLSGLTGLIYQVVWLRMLVLVFGHTVQAVTMVLAAFMAGLAAGSFLWGRQRGGHPLRTYGGLEVGVGLYCATMPLLLSWVPALHAELGRRLGASATGGVQFAGIFGLLVVPTALMGGTLPVLSRAVAAPTTALARPVGALYAVNTLGAVAGTALAGYVLLPAIGNRATLALAAATSVATGMLALLASRRPPWSAWRPPASPDSENGGPGAAAAERSRRTTLAAIGVSGAVSMVYEVSWTRALALVIGSSTYAFTAMLLAFLVGIAGGSAAYAAAWGRRRASPAVFATIQVAIAAAVTAVLLGFQDAPALFLIGLTWSTAPAFVQLLQLATSMGALLLFTPWIGATFPCALAITARGSGRVGDRVGQVFAANTLGAIAGAMLAGFVLLPTLGAHASIKAGIAANLGLAALLLMSAREWPGWGRWSAVVGIAGLGIGVTAIPAWDPRVMSSGPAVYGADALRWRGREAFARTLERATLLYYRDGLTSTVSVHRDGQGVFLRVNGKTDAGTGGDMQTQVMLGHLPLLLHPGPERVLVIGLGSGITAGAVARHPVARLDIVEIEPAMLAAARFFAPVHGDVLHDRRVRVLVTDGRRHLTYEPDRYDVIISEPSNPWISGLSSLFSVEFFRLARSRLGPNGLMTQWVQAYDLQLDDLRMIVNSFRAVFPQATVWGNTGGDLLLVGQVAPGPLDLERIRRRYEANPALREDLGRIGIRAWPSLLGQFLLEEPGLGRLVGGAALNTDDRLPLEFSAPRGLYSRTAGQNLAAIRNLRTTALPAVTPESRAELARADVRFAIGMGFLAQERPEEALQQLDEAARLDPRHAPSLFWAGAISLQQGRPAVALALLRRVHDLDPGNVQAFLLAGASALAMGRPHDAVGYLERALTLAPTDQGVRDMLERARRAAPPGSV